MKELITEAMAAIDHLFARIINLDPKFKPSEDEAFRVLQRLKEEKTKLETPAPAQTPKVDDTKKIPSR